MGCVSFGHIFSWKGTSTSNYFAGIDRSENADSFHVKKFCSRLSSRKIHFLNRKRPFCFFVRLWGLYRQRTLFIVWILWKAHSGLLISDNWTFYATCYCWGVTSGYTECPGKKETTMFFVISSIKLGRFRWNLMCCILNKFATKPCKRFPPHLNNVIYYLVKLKMLISHVLPLSCWRNSGICLILTAASKFTKFESSWLQHEGNLATEGVQKTHHWSGRTNTATENGTGRAGSRRHCSSHSSVASSVCREQWCVFIHLLL